MKTKIIKDKYPHFLPTWTNAINHIQEEESFKWIKDKFKKNFVIHESYKKYNLSWYSGECCLTGEAFFNQYRPEECDICDNNTYDASLMAMESKNKFNEYKNKMAAHLKSKHPAVWKRWKDRV